MAAAAAAAADTLLFPTSTLRSPTPLPVVSFERPLFLGVTGGSASGKTTVCERIAEHLGARALLISCDAFYKPLTAEQAANPSSVNFDHPEAFDYDLALKTLRMLRNREAVEIPEYDFKTNARLPTGRVCQPADVVIFEGILALYSTEVREMLDLKVFVETDPDVRLARRIKRDIAERGRDLLSVLEQYERTVKPSYEEFISPTKRYADLIVPRGGENRVAIDLIARKVDHFLSALSLHKAKNPYC